MRAGFFRWAPTPLIPTALAVPMVVPIGMVQGVADPLPRRRAPR